MPKPKKNNDGSVASVKTNAKIKTELKIKDDFKWTEKQQQFIQMAKNKKAKVVFLSGPAGTAKTLLSTYVALQALKDKHVSEIIYVRSAVESSESKIGFLPGTADNKMEYYNLPFVDKLNELLSPGQVKFLMESGHVYSYPVNYARGMSWRQCFLIFDEAQNSSAKEIITLLTRVGDHSKIFILADPQQSDLNDNRKGGFEKIKSAFSSEESENNGIYTFDFNEEDIKRSELVKFIVSKTKDLK